MDEETICLICQDKINNSYSIICHEDEINNIYHPKCLKQWLSKCNKGIITRNPIKVYETYKNNRLKERKEYKTKAYYESEIKELEEKIIGMKRIINKMGKDNKDGYWLNGEEEKEMTMSITTKLDYLYELLKECERDKLRVLMV